MTIEAFLARLYSDDEFLRLFMAAPFETACREGLDDATARALASLDLSDLALAASSFAKKRSTHPHGRR